LPGIRLSYVTERCLEVSKEDVARSDETNH
jgi:hypothetical protein